MTAEEIRKYLDNNRGIKDRLEGLYLRLEQVMSAAAYKPPSYDINSDIHAINKHKDTFADYAAITETIQQRIKQAESIQAVMLSMILSLDDQTDYEIVYLYYIEGLTTRDISIRLDRDQRTIQRRRLRALTKIVA